MFILDQGSFLTRLCHIFCTFKMSIFGATAKAFRMFKAFKTAVLMVLMGFFWILGFVKSSTNVSCCQEQRSAAWQGWNQRPKWSLTRRDSAVATAAGARDAWQISSTDIKGDQGKRSIWKIFLMNNKQLKVSFRTLFQCLMSCLWSKRHNSNFQTSFHGFHF